MIYFNVDVETTGTNFFEDQLLTVGVVPLSDKGIILDEGFHVAMEYDLDNINSETLAWWKEQSEEAYLAAWEGVRIDRESAAAFLHAYILSFDTELNNRIFVANPVSFDHPWILKLFSETGFDMPFSHRTLCLGSMNFGAYTDLGYYQARRVHQPEPKIPHHALHDARAQAESFGRFLEKSLNKVHAADSGITGNSITAGDFKVSASGQVIFGGTVTS